MNSSLNIIARSAGLNMIVQVAIRLFSFLVNSIIIRFVSIEYIGIVNVRLALLSTSILFLSREPIRKVCLDKGKEDWKIVNQICWLSVPIGACIAVILSYIWIYILPSPNVPFYSESVIIYAIASLICLCSESCFIQTQLSLQTNVKVFVESMSLTIRSVSNCLLLAIFPSLGLKGFCISELIYALLFPLLYLIKIQMSLKSENSKQSLSIHSISELLPSFKTHIITSDSYQLIFLFFKQSILKQLLTEGEKYILSFSSISMYDQGIYDIVNSLGSLFARFLFQPLEEGFYLYFSQNAKRGTTQNKDVIEVCLLLLRCLFYFGFIIITFGYSYSSTLLFLYGGQSLASPIAIHMLRVYCVYVLVLGLNGISEAFFMATAEKEQLNQYNWNMTFYSIIFIILSLVFTTPLLGSTGYIVANIVNMTIRCCHHYIYIKSSLQASCWQSIIPSYTWLGYDSIVCLGLALIEPYFIPYSLKRVMMFIMIGACGGLSVLFVMWLCDKQMIIKVKMMMKKKQE